MTVYLYQRLRAHGALPRSALLDALMLSELRKCSFAEALVSGDVRQARAISSCFARDGEKADQSWRPDPRLLLDLPPGICERYLAFPFRERSGAVEVATVSPFDKGVRDEFERHIGRPIALFRGSLQGLLAAAGACVDLGALTTSLSEPPPRAGTSPIPLVRKSDSKRRSRDRTRTAPGMGAEVSSSFPPDAYDSSPYASSPWSSPELSPLSQLERARDERELTFALARLLVPPFLILGVNDTQLLPLLTSSAGETDAIAVSLEEESALKVGTLHGKYMGPWAPCPVHGRFAYLFREGDLVRVERVGSRQAGLLVVQKVAFDGSEDGEILNLARLALSRIMERARFFG